MRFYFLKMAASEFKTHRKRLTLTTLAIAWGIFTILLLLAFGEGLRKELTRSGKGIGENIVVVWGGQTSKPWQGLSAGRPIRFSEEDLDAITANIPQILGISGEYNRWDADAGIGPNQRSIMVVGVDHDFGDMRNQIPCQGGRFLHPEDIALKRRVVFMGWEAVAKFYTPDDAVGKTVVIDKIPFVIIGVLKEKLQSSNYNNMDKSKSYIPVSTFESMYGSHYYSNIVYSLQNVDDTKSVEKQLYRLLATRHQFDPGDEMALSFWNVAENLQDMQKGLLGFQFFLGFIGALTMIISGVGLANIIYASIKERTREIGIKLAIGAYPNQILFQIVTESFFFSFVGGFMGGGAAWLVVKGIGLIPVSNEALSFLTNPRLSFPIAAAATLLLMIITFFAGYFPARKAARQDPIESLRYE